MCSDVYFTHRGIYIIRLFQDILLYRYFIYSHIWHKKTAKTKSISI